MKRDENVIPLTPPAREGENLMVWTGSLLAFDATRPFAIAQGDNMARVSAS